MSLHQSQLWLFERELLPKFIFQSITTIPKKFEWFQNSIFNTSRSLTFHHIWMVALIWTILNSWNYSQRVLFEFNLIVKISIYFSFFPHHICYPNKYQSLLTGFTNVSHINTPSCFICVINCNFPISFKSIFFVDFLWIWYQFSN